MPVSDHQEIAELLVATCRRLGARGLCRATSGNFSTRVGASQFMITQSGVEKSLLAQDQLMICDLDCKPEDPMQRASAEAPLHACLYRLGDDIAAVLHTHSVAATVLSRATGEALRISGYEMQKAIRGISSHEESLVIPVFDNQQNMQRLAQEVEAAWHTRKLAGHCFLIRGHGLYAWGSDLAEAERHVDGIEFLLECLLAASTANLQ